MNTWTNREPRVAGFPEVASPEERAPKARHILVVDDDRGLRSLLAHFLRGAGFRVSCAEDGEAAWDALSREEFDVVITDHDMPRLTGLGLLRRIRAISSRIPVIMISGLLPVGEVDLPQLLTPGLALQKPFSLVEFMTRVQGVLPSDGGGREAISQPLRPDFGHGEETAAVQPRDAMVA